MSRATSMIVWLFCASIHLGIVLYISPLILQLLLMGSMEGLIGVLTWNMHRTVERRGAHKALRCARDLAMADQAPDPTHLDDRADYQLPVSIAAARRLGR